MDDPAAVETEPPPSAADALAIIEREQAHTGAGLMPNLVMIYAIWGVAWLVAGGLYFAYETGHLGGSATVVGAITVGVVAAVVSIVTSVRSGRGVRGAGDLQGMLYGFSWTIAMIAMGLLISATVDAMPEPLQGTLIPALFVFVTGSLYLGGGAVWSDVLQYGIGVWIIALAVVSVFAGQPANALILGLGGGAALLFGAGWLAFRGRAR